ncbi:NAD-dependent dehydratase [Streptomyces hygroscopicus subsp. hygroscopicus]|nr:NAD(P)H-binding protein [Streptomyces hygroscopicus]GLX49216.1 NAD-dependent dehydratase [Streptomyces hygroscopicus subsp. hygroscopicus]
MDIAIIGASGRLGGAIAREALARGHEVMAIGRDPAAPAAIRGARAVPACLDDRDSIADAVAGSYVIVPSVTDRTTADRSRIPATAALLLEPAPRAGVRRIAFVGGGGSLHVAPGPRAVDAPGFPKRYRAEALAQAEAPRILEGAGDDVEWTFTPPPQYLLPGEKTGRHVVRAGDEAVVNADGDSAVTEGDFAAVLVDELEQNRFPRRRFTAGS